MRCKVGDLAVIVRADQYPENLGAVVEVVERCFDAPVGDWFIRSVGRPLLFDWVSLDGEESPGGSDFEVVTDDASLRPIRDNDGLDQTLTWKQLPSPLEIIKEISHG